MKASEGAHLLVEVTQMSPRLGNWMRVAVFENGALTKTLTSIQLLEGSNGAVPGVFRREDTF